MTDMTHTSTEEPEPVKTGMEIGDILKILPHRYPFLLIDRVIELVRMKSIVGRGSGQVCAEVLVER